MNNKKQTTIFDVALAAGVSKGTVDRVIHNRGEVSERSRVKVLAAIKELGYELNIHASLLSSKKRYRIIAVIPSFHEGEYWEQVYAGLQMIQEDSVMQKVSVEILYFNQFDSESFNVACLHTKSLNPNGVLIAPIFKERARELIEELHTLKIPTVCIDSTLDKTNYLAYYGIPQFESGYLAAHILLGDCRGGSCEVANFSLDRGTTPINESTHNRYCGITAYAKDHNIECTIYDCKIQANNFIENMRQLDAFFAEHPTISRLVTLNSRAHTVAEWLELREITDKQFVGFDALQKNIDSLKRGYITTLIAERISLHVYRAIGAITDYIVLNQRPEKKDNYSSMDILTKYNIDFY